MRKITKRYAVKQNIKCENTSFYFINSLFTAQRYRF